MNLTSSEKCQAAERLIQKGQYEDAGFLLDQVLESHPQHGAALVAKSVLQLKAGRVPEAKHLLQMAATLDPDNALILTNLANLALFENRQDDALAHLQAAIERHPDHLPAVLLLAQIHLQRGDLGAAQAQLSRAARLGPADPAVLVARASFALSCQNLTEAAALLDKALEVDPDHIRACSAKAQLCVLMGDYDGAADLAAKAHLEAPLDPDIAVTLAQVYLASGALGEAQKLMDRFKVRFADFAPVVLCSAEIAIARGQVADALADGARWLRKAPRDAGRMIGFLKVLKKAGAWQQLLDLTSKLSLQEARADAVLNLREEALHALGRTEEAWTSWADRRALPADRPEPPLRVTLPARAPLLDELVLMRFVDAWARDGNIEVTGRTALSDVWNRLQTAGSIQWVSQSETSQPLLADLAARTVLHAPEKAVFQRYLAPDPERRDAWKTALPADGRPLVGIFWDGRAPGLLMDHLKDVLADLPVHPVSLQFDDNRHQLRAWPEALDAGVQLKGVADLVNLVDCLDLVIGPDGIPMHVAGALGRRGVVLLKENHEWYWAGDAEQSHWYPSVERLVSPVGPYWSNAKDALRSLLDTSGS